MVDGVFAEIQFLMKEIYDVKENHSHPIYEKIQGIERKYAPTEKKGVPDAHWAEEDKKEHAALTKQMSEVWVDCWKSLF